MDFPEYFGTINRALITVWPKQPFFDWVNSVFPEEEPLKAEQWDEVSSFLVEESETIEGRNDSINEHYDHIFRHMLLMICTDPEKWPQSLSLDLFHEWFDVRYSSMVFDLMEATDPLVHDEGYGGLLDDEFLALDDEELEDEDELDEIMYEQLEEQAMIIDIQRHKDAGGELPEA